MKRKREESGAEIDVDHEFLDQVLNNLYDLGEGGHDKQSKKHKRKKRESEEDEEQLIEKTSRKKACSRQGFVTAHDDNVSESKDPTTAQTQSNVEIVTFLDPLKKNTLKREGKPEAKPPGLKDFKKKDPHEGLSIEKARLEVHRFGITGFQKQQQRVFEQDRAIMLGARPPKKQYVNYKMYQTMLKEKRLKEKEEAEPDNQRKNKKPGKKKIVKRKTAPSGKELTGLRGRFKDGVLMLNSRDIQKVNSKRRK